VQEQTFWANLTCYSSIFPEGPRILNLGHPQYDAGALSARNATLCCMSVLSTQSVASKNYILRTVYSASKINPLKPMHHPLYHTETQHSANRVHFCVFRVVLIINIDCFPEQH
jgi:hypothetical protein